MSQRSYPVTCDYIYTATQGKGTAGRDLDPTLIWPCADRCCCCCPEPCKVDCRCGVPYDEDFNTVEILDLIFILFQMKYD